MHMLEEPPPFRTVAQGLCVPPQVEAVVMKALKKEREERYQSALEFAHAFAGAALSAPALETSQPLPSTKVVMSPAVGESNAPIPLAAIAKTKSGTAAEASSHRTVEPPAAQPQGSSRSGSKPPAHSPQSTAIPDCDRESRSGQICRLWLGSAGRYRGRDLGFLPAGGVATTECDEPVIRRNCAHWARREVDTSGKPQPCAEGGEGQSQGRTNFPVFVKDIFHRGPETYGNLLALMGLGSICGSLSIASAGNFRKKGMVALGALICLGAGISGFALSKSLPLSEGFLVLAGASMMAVFATVNSLVQLITTNEMRGRVMSVYNFAFRGGMPMGNLLSGWLVPLFTAPVVLSVNGFALILLALYFLLIQRKLAAL